MKDIQIKVLDGEVGSRHGISLGIKVAIRCVKEVRKLNSTNFQLVSMLVHIEDSLQDVIDEMNAL